MKRFGDFFSEARTSQAAERAKKLGLKGDGHGAWYDRGGELIAKTEKGDLKFFTKGQKPGKDEPNPKKPKVEPIKKPKVKTTTVTGKSVSDAASPEGQKASSKGEDESKKRTSDALTVVFGRFNPPTTGHKKLLDMAKNISGGDDLRIFPSRSNDPKKNPLDPGTKIKFMKKMFPEFEENIVNDGDMKTIFNVLTTASEEGYKEVKIVVGSDRLSEFKNLATKYNGELYNFDMIDVLPAGERDSDAEGVEGMSASKLRKAAKEDDFEGFKKGIPSSLEKNEVNNLFNAVKKAMGMEVKESYSLWEIAPRYDYTGLREKYYNKEIFKRGDIVESLTTGLVGEVIRRGANHLICVTKEGYMFKSWIKDVTEAYTEKKMDKEERLPGKPNTLVGTKGYLKYATKMVPGSSYGKEFINKYKAKK
tara:strand:+ start:6116 stop:7375 length:1260 start_codon:yes stop_codon:yes gene_type:complete